MEYGAKPEGKIPVVSHEAVIRKALAEGKSVPQEVLAEYPELAKPEKTPETKLEPNISNLLSHLREAPQSKSTESYLRKTYGDDVVDQAHNERLMTRSPKGIYTITLKGRELVKDLPGKNVNLYAEGKRILSEGITLKPENKITISEQSQPYERYYGISSVPTTWQGYKVNLSQYPNENIIVYHTKSEWLASRVLEPETRGGWMSGAKGERLGDPAYKSRAGAGGYGYDTQEEAIQAFIEKYLSNSQQG